MWYAVEMCPGATMCVASFIKIGTGIEKLWRGEWKDRKEIP
jgi:hypothetical protein